MLFLVIFTSNLFGKVWDMMMFSKIVSFHVFWLLEHMSACVRQSDCILETKCLKSSEWLKPWTERSFKRPQSIIITQSETHRWTEVRTHRSILLWIMIARNIISFGCGLPEATWIPNNRTNLEIWMDFFSLSLMKMIEYGNLLFNIENLVIKRLIDYNLQRKKKGKVLDFPIIYEINKSSINIRVCISTWMTLFQIITTQ